MMIPPQSVDPACEVQVLLRSQLLAQGHCDRSIATMVSSGQLTWIRHGTYVRSASWEPLDEQNRHVVLVRAVMMRARTDTVASHGSAAAVWNAPTWGLDLDTVHVTRPPRRAGRALAGIQPHGGALRPEDRTTFRGIDVTAVARTVLDILSTDGVEKSLVVANHFLHHRQLDNEGLQATAQFMAHWHGTLGAPLLVGLADERVESVGESRTLHLIWSQGLPIPQPQYEVLGRGGDVVARLDFAWPERKVWLEFDGKEKYVKFLREGETVADVVLREKRREKLIEDLTGWRCLRITWADLYHPERVAARLRALLFAPALAS